MVTTSRDPRDGRIIVPHFFFTTAPPNNLLELSSILSKHNPELMPLTYNIKGSRTGYFTMVPFLYDRNPSSSAFVTKAKEFGEALATTKAECAYTVMDCSLTIWSQGKLIKISDYKVVFDHLVK